MFQAGEGVPVPGHPGVEGAQEWTQAGQREAPGQRTGPRDLAAEVEQGVDTGEETTVGQQEEQGIRHRLCAGGKRFRHPSALKWHRHVTKGPNEVGEATGLPTTDRTPTVVEHPPQPFVNRHGVIEGPGTPCDPPTRPWGETSISRQGSAV